MSTPIERAALALAASDDYADLFVEDARIALTAALNVDEIAQAIRVADGNHDLGAGALAETVVAFLLGGEPR